MPNDILSLVSEDKRPFWCEAYALLQGRREGMESWTLAIPICIRLIQAGGFVCSPFVLVETVIGVIDRRTRLVPIDDELPAGVQRVSGSHAIAGILARMAKETHAILLRHYPV